ncbi:MAG: hypothetical protein ICV75_01780 [Nitrospiraceae bacterium]|nr:hypothetical protein [Nitrospiraceae bacterium]
MKQVRPQVLPIVLAAAGLILSTTAYTPSVSAGGSGITPVASQSTSGSSSEEQRNKEQAQKSQETPSASQFGGAPRDQETRERHHRQYPESAQHLGPQEEEQGQSSKGGGKTRPGHEEKRKDAGSGVGH